MNDVFASEFAIDFQDFGNCRSIHNFSCFLRQTVRTTELRISVKFQHPVYEYLENILSNFETVKLRTLCSEPFRRGVQPEYVEDNEIPVIKTGNLKSQFIDLADCQWVSKDFYKSKKDIAGVQKNDVLVASTGVRSIGKVDIYDSSKPALADGHLSIIRLNPSEVAPLFVTYYLRSILGNMQIERDLSGRTNQIEVYPDQLEKIKVIKISKQRQALIAENIRDKIHKLHQNRLSLTRKRREIDKLILQSIQKEAK